MNHAACLIILLLVAPAASAQPLPSSVLPVELNPASVDEIEQATQAHLEQAQKFIVAEQWSEAVTTLRRVMESDADRLIALPDSADEPFARYVSIRRFGQGLLSRWAVTAPAALEGYRNELNPLSERWYQLAVAENDEQRLRAIADQLFVTRYGDDALFALGDYALERGHYVQARAYWEAIHPALRTPRLPDRTWPPPARPLWFAIPDEANDPFWEVLQSALERAAPVAAWAAYPDSDVPLPDVRARLILVSIMEGSWDRAARELALLQRTAPDAKGAIGGRSGKYVDLLAKLMEDARHWPTTIRADWPTFAGDANRNCVASTEIDVGGRPLWRLPLAVESAEDDQLVAGGLRIAEGKEEALAYNPIVSGRQVFVCQSYSIRGVDLYTGQPVFSATHPFSEDEADVRTGTIYEAPVPGRFPGPYMTSRLGVPRYTLTGSNAWLFTRLGSQITRHSPVSDLTERADGILVGLDLEQQGKLLPGFPLETESLNWSFDGSPVCDGRRLYVAMRRQDEVRVEAHVACYDVPTSRLLWKRFVCGAETPGQGRADEITHNLLSLHEGVIYCNTNLGAVAAISADDGKLAWLVKYPRAVFAQRPAAKSNAHFSRLLTPAVLYRDMVLVAPADCDRIFALDAGSGQVLWTTPPGQAADAIHLLGVAGEHLIASGDYLYWLDVYSGHLVGQFPPPQRDAPGYARPSPRGFGRGVLAGDKVYWPTEDAIYVFWQRPQQTVWGWEPWPARAPISLAAYGVRGGNLVVAGDVLLIAGSHELVAFDPFGARPTESVRPH